LGDSPGSFLRVYISSRRADRGTCPNAVTKTSESAGWPTDAQVSNLPHKKFVFCSVPEKPDKLSGFTNELTCGIKYLAQQNRTSCPVSLFLPGRSIRDNFFFRKYKNRT
jgi:hypothetical protein